MPPVCMNECAMLARQATAYASSVRSRLLPSIAALDESVHAEIRSIYAAVMEFQPPPHDDDEMAVAAATEIEQEAIDDLIFVQEHVLELAVAGLFHLWERSMRRVLLRHHRLGFELPGVPGKTPAEVIVNVERAKAPDLMSALHRAGNGEASAATRARLYELQLIANVVKHGEGSALRQLAARHPERFGSDTDGILLAELLELSENDLTTFGKAVADFWCATAFLPDGSLPPF